MTDVLPVLALGGLLLAGVAILACALNPYAAFEDQAHAKPHRPSGDRLTDYSYDTDELEGWPAALAADDPPPELARLADITPEEEAEAQAVAERVIHDLHRKAAAEAVERRHRYTEGAS